MFNFLTEWFCNHLWVASKNVTRHFDGDSDKRPYKISRLYTCEKCLKQKRVQA